MPDATPFFDPASDDHVALWDELSLWSAMAGLALLEHVPMSARRVLDLGCGAGFPALELAERLGAGARVVGVDTWATALRRARDKREVWPVANADLVRGDGARLPFRDDAFQLVVSNLGVNNFGDPEGTFAEIRRVLASGGSLAIATNLVGHFEELYEAYSEVLADDARALERLRAHVEHRATVDALAGTLERHGLRVTGVHRREVLLRFADGGALLAHHFIRLGFLPAWREVAGEEAAPRRLAALREVLDRRARIAGEVRLTVPLAVLIART
jgi:ubiquinone/menaquinone biosynthesis C-methylase UbiE